LRNIAHFIGESKGYAYTFYGPQCRRDMHYRYWQMASATTGMESANSACWLSSEWVQLYPPPNIIQVISEAVLLSTLWCMRHFGRRT